MLRAASNRLSRLSRSSSNRDALQRRYSQRFSTEFDPDDAESLANFHKTASAWSFGSEQLDLSFESGFDLDQTHQSQSVDDLTDQFSFFQEIPIDTTPRDPRWSGGVDIPISLTVPQPTFTVSLSDHEPIQEDPTEYLDEQAEVDEAALPAPEFFIGLTLPLWREVAFVAVICLAMFTTQVGLGQVLILLPTIGEAFNVTNAGDLGWLVAGYSLTVGTFILMSGRLGDIYGYKTMLIIGYVWFAVWTMICGLAVYDTRNGYVMFVFARVLAGIGPAITMPNGLAIFGAAYPEGMRKAMAFALFGACAPSGSIVGAAFAGLFNLTWWPWTFFSFAIVLAVLAVLVILVVPSIERTAAPPRTFREIILALDLFGGVVGVASLILINFAWNQASVVGWTQYSYVYICLMLGLILLPCFLGIELWLAPSPLIPFRAFTSEVAFVMGCIACGWGSFGIWLFYLLQFYATLRGGNPLQISAWFSPIAASGFLASVTTGIILGKVRASFVMVLSMSFFTIGIILVATAPVNQIYWAQTFVCSVIIPWGMDMSFPAGTIIMSNSIEKKHQGVAASLINTVVNYSISMGLGMASTVETQVNGGGLTDEDRLRGYRGAWYLGIGLAGLGLLVSVAFAVKEARGSSDGGDKGLEKERLPDQ